MSLGEGYKRKEKLEEENHLIGKEMNLFDQE